ncbi:uncharacterized protein BJ171DRAFT_508140 [Polychytrium aggregatum]|uniref:uncharacterized protein n=1 Tax=Polychytrium aggregatum TaxID=110093 RepID=UPI0022FEE9A1|nr:uncharacterized protein BJ171DRAFT_508140 [Polychytrium aggregatum]KAI9203818.1 hypothetical protein BJ171DRAFT_508140 [Polychytrium aggregatum]
MAQTPESIYALWEQVCQQAFSLNTPYLELAISLAEQAHSSPSGTRIDLDGLHSLPREQQSQAQTLLAQLGIDPQSGVALQTLDPGRLGRIKNLAREAFHRTHQDHLSAELERLLQENRSPNDAKVLSERDLHAVSQFVSKYQKHVGAVPFLLGLAQLVDLTRQSPRQKVVWVLDDAVFTQSAGDGFMESAVLLLCQTLGMQFQQPSSADQVRIQVGEPTADLSADGGVRAWFLASSLSQLDLVKLSIATHLRSSARATGTIRREAAGSKPAPEPPGSLLDWIMYIWNSLRLLLIRALF